MEKSNSTLLNKRGDMRGKNGRTAKRGPGGRFLSGGGGSRKKKKVVAAGQIVPPEPFSQPLLAVQGLSATLPLVAAPPPATALPPAPAAAVPQTKRALRVVSNLVNYSESSDECSDEDIIECESSDECSDEDIIELVEATAPVVVPVFKPPTYTTTTTQIAFRQDCLDAPTYSTATSGSELDRMVAEGIFKPNQTTVAQKDYVKFITYQCAIDRRDNGGMLLHVVEIDTPIPPMSRFRTFDTTSQVDIVGVTTDNVARSVLAGIFVQRQLLVGTHEEIEHDMKIFSELPFHMIAVMRGDIIEGGAVFRAHTLNTGERAIHLELIATKFNANRGGGSALMRAMRKLSQVTPLHNGHIVALTLKNKATNRFYQRKLPEHGPQARAIMNSIALLDENTILKRNLDIRYTTVFSV